MSQKLKICKEFRNHPQQMHCKPWSITGVHMRFGVLVSSPCVDLSTLTISLSEGLQGQLHLRPQTGGCRTQVHQGLGY